jgi:hypothetical protein
VAIHAAFTKELSGSQYPDYRLLALIGQDSHLDLAFLKVKHRVRDIALREHIPILLKLQDGLSGSNVGNEDLSVKHGFACARHANLLCRNGFWDNETRRGGLHIAVRSTRQASAEPRTLRDGIPIKYPHGGFYDRHGRRARDAAHAAAMGARNDRKAESMGSFKATGAACPACFVPISGIERFA